jgi:tetratricopeptide (TPR) repeat protein
MATDPARSTASRHLWQVPVFLLGAAAVAAVLILRPHIGADTLSAAERQLHDARQALDKDPTAAVQRGLRVIALTDRFPQLAGEAHFVVGSARLKLSDDAGADTVRERLQARLHLEQADKHGVPEADRPKLQYRLAKVMLLLGGDPAKVVELLEKSVEADDPAEGYGLLAEACTHLSPPDLAKAIEAGKQQLDRELRTGEARGLAAARFRLGRLHLQRKEVKEGRLLLAKVGTEAVPDQFYAARVMLAESYEETQEWANAARNWQQARQNPKLTAPEKGKALFHLGRCYANEQRAKDATAAFEEAVALGGEEGQAAGLRLAELKLDGDPPGAQIALAAALKPVQGPDDYHNALVPLDDARALAEAVVRSARDKGDWESARKAGEAYTRVAPPGKDDELIAGLLDAQAVALAEKAKADGPAAGPLDEQARDLWRQAALAYERAAGKLPSSETSKVDQAALLWKSAQLALKAGQPQRAQEALARATQLEGGLGPAKTAEAWLLIGNTYHQGQQFKDAREAYQKCLGEPGPFTLKARFALAEIDLAESKFEDAERGFQDVLKTVREANQTDADLQEQSVYAWARVAYAKQSAVKEELREYATAEQRLLGALQQYPESAQAPAARRLLGLSYWTEARLKSRALERSGLSPDERKAYERQRLEYLQKSAEQYDKLEEQLLARQRAGDRLTADQATCLKQASFWGTDCYFWLQKYDEAVRRYGALTLRYQGHPEELIALSQICQCYVFLGQPEKATAVLKRMREALDKIPDDAFDGKLETHRRDFWEKWLAEMSKPAVKPGS